MCVPVDAVPALNRCFIGEPIHLCCTGLDSTTAMHLVATLRQLAQGGRAILTTIHQPSSRLYQMLDKLLLLSEGYACLPSPH